MADEPAPKGNGNAFAVRAGRKIATLSARAKAAEKEAKDLKAQLAKAPKADDVAKLRNELNAGRHNDAFKAKALKLGIKPELVEVLRRASGYQAADGEPDESAIKAAIRATVKASGGKATWCAPKPAEGTAPADGTAAKPGETPAAPAKPARLPRGVGSERGASGKPAGLTVTRAQASDPKWMHENRAAYNAACADGTLVTVV